MNGALTTGSQFACLSAGRAGLDDQIKRAVRIGEELVAVAEGLAIKLIKVGRESPRILRRDALVLQRCPIRCLADAGQA